MFDRNDPTPIAQIGAAIPLDLYASRAELRDALEIAKLDAINRELQLKAHFESNMSEFNSAIEANDRKLVAVSDSLEQLVSVNLPAMFRSQMTDLRLTVFLTALLSLVGLVTFFVSFDEAQDTAFSSGYGARETIGDKLDAQDIELKIQNARSHNRNLESQVKGLREMVEHLENAHELKAD